MNEDLVIAANAVRQTRTAFEEAREAARLQGLRLAELRTEYNRARREFRRLSDEIAGSEA